MTWFDWFLIGLWVFNAFVIVSSVGKAKKPTEPHVAAIVVLLDLALIAGLLITRGALA